MCAWQELLKLGKEFQQERTRIYEQAQQLEHAKEEQNEVAVQLQAQLDELSSRLEQDRALVSAQKAELERLKAQGLDSEEEELEIALKLQQQLLKLGKQFQEVCACSGCACGACDACGAV